MKTIVTLKQELDPKTCQKIRTILADSRARIDFDPENQAVILLDANADVVRSVKILLSQAGFIIL